ncbi:MAG: ASKHA domain-containing protein [Ardenticatenaceae bacterium]|nr:ASKHA domain-containing protein [Ardenticatenaceae bacterium]
MAVPVTFQPMGRMAEAALEETLWTAARRAKVLLPSICGGQGTCGKCRVRILHGRVSPTTEIEAEHLSPEELAEGYRLACETCALGPAVIETPLIRADKRKSTLPDIDAEIEVSPGLSKVHIQTPPPSLADPRSDAARVTDTLLGLDYPAPRLDLATLRALPKALRAADYHLTCVLNKDHLIAIEPGDTATDFFGLAIDLGSTTVAAYLAHLDTGERLAAAATTNRQTAFGDDVMSRIAHAMAGGLAELRQAALETLNALAQEVCAAAGVEPTSVYAATITGNTCMLQLLAGLSPAHLGVVPYVAVTSDQTNLTANELGLAIHPAAQVWLLPGAGAYVGADAVSAVLATGMFASDEVQLLIDLGTNAEIVLGSRYGLMACATAAGPAFEGARIQYGMRAAPGAIDRVWTEDGTVLTRTIGRRRPVGLAGTGLVSAVAALRKGGMIDDRGLFREHRRLQQEWWAPGPCGLELVLARATKWRPALTLSQADVGEFQLAKAAVQAGIKILLQKMSLSVSDIRRVLLAGAFGSFMEVSDALAAGLLPEVPAEGVRSVGNAAGLGAMMALLSAEKRQLGRELARQIHYVELSAEADFHRQFARSLPFG